MIGFDLSHNEDVLKKAVLNRFDKGRDEVVKTLTSAGYKHIIKSVSTSEYLEDLVIDFVDGVDIEGQNVLQVFAHGGQIKKGDEFIPIPPSDAVRKYLSTRK